jgi:PIN domain nuclease of toxin-antitoxin system
MNILLDTHAMIWFLEGAPQLGKTVETVIADRNNKVLFSVASHWELCIKVSIGKIALMDHWHVMLGRTMREIGIQWLPIDPNHSRTIVDLPFHHRDPFDRLLIAQALCEQLTVATHDAQIRKYPVPIIW